MSSGSQVMPCISYWRKQGIQNFYEFEEGVVGEVLRVRGGGSRRSLRIRGGGGGSRLVGEVLRRVRGG